MAALRGSAPPDGRRRAAERVRSGTGAFLEKNFWRRVLPYVPSNTILAANAIAIAPAETVTCRATMAYRGGGEGSPAGLERLVFSYERRSEAIGERWTL